ncbi:urea transporter [Glutamicibacter sp.]|uniref:urea transporter n=1 Tax=Glutamicibacter sp. TaxID=1931995 RepID=UPI0028BEA7D4|nr:urea transporter [Glutamicibacter sp.]
MNAPGTNLGLRTEKIAVRSSFSALTKSLSQIFFASNWATGLAFLLAFAICDLIMAGFVLLGTLAAVGTAKLLGNNKGPIRLGMQGYCGALVGASVFISLGATPAAALVTLVGAATTIPVTKWLAAIFELPFLRRFQLPCITAPFCIVSSVILVSAVDPRTQQALAAPTTDNFTELFFYYVLTDISEVIFLNAAVSGLIILIGLFLAHWKLGIAALLGGAVESSIAYFLASPDAEIQNGLAGYNGVLVAIALATVFITGTWQPWVVAVGGLLLLIPIDALIRQLGTPVYTWPFVITTWLVLIIVNYIPVIRRAA